MLYIPEICFYNTAFFGPVLLRTISNRLNIAALSYSIWLCADGDRQTLMEDHTVAPLFPLLPSPAHLTQWTGPGMHRNKKIQVNEASGFLVRVGRSRCHKAVFNRIWPSFLDIFHDSRAVSHFLDNITPNSCSLSGLTLYICGVWGSQ